MSSGTNDGENTVSQRDLRVSDTEREHVVNLLQKAIGRGLLDLGEFTTRTDTAYAARTRGELNAVLVDLPGMVHAEAPRPRREPAAAPRTFAMPDGEKMELTGKFSTISRSGNWRVPAHLVVCNKFGETKLDFTDAEFEHDTCYVELASRWGSTELIVPRHAAVSTNEIRNVKFGAVHSRVDHVPNGSPRIIVGGHVHGGSLTVRYPSALRRMFTS